MQEIGDPGPGINAVGQSREGMGTATSCDRHDRQWVPRERYRNVWQTSLDQPS
jgi:hypothetical protein